MTSLRSRQGRLSGSDRATGVLARPIFRRNTKNKFPLPSQGRAGICLDVYWLVPIPPSPPVYRNKVNDAGHRADVMKMKEMGRFPLKPKEGLSGPRAHRPWCSPFENREG